MAIYRWEPEKDLLFIEDRISKLFEDALAGLDLDIKKASPWTPPCDIYETADAFILKAEVPGVKLEDIILEISERTILFVGERKRLKEVSEENYHRIERSYGRFVRSFTLPCQVREGEVSASLKDGVLTVTIPKKEDTSREKVINVKID